MQVLCEDVPVSEDFERYLNVRRLFRIEAKQVVEAAVAKIDDEDYEFVRSYGEKGRYAEAFAEWGTNFGDAILQRVSNIPLGIFKKHKDYSMDRETYIETYMPRDIISECVEHGDVAKAVMFLDKQAALNEAERKARSAHARRMFIGFSRANIKSVINTQIKTKAYNLSAGALTDLVNSVSRNMDRRECEKRVRELFDLYVIELAAACRRAVEMSVDGFCLCMIERLGFHYDCHWPLLDERKATAIRHNLMNEEIEDEDLVDAVLQMVLSDPFSEEVYACLYDLHLLPPEIIDSLAEVFAVDVEEPKARWLALKEKESEAKKVECEKKAREKAAADKAARTAFGIEYETLEDKNAALKSSDEFYKGVVAAIYRFRNKDDISVGFTANLKESVRENIRLEIGLAETDFLIAFYDTTFWKNGEFGLAFTYQGIRWKNKEDKSGCHFITWNDLSNMAIRADKSGVSVVVFGNGLVFTDHNSGHENKQVAQLLNELCDYWREAKFKKNDSGDKINIKANGKGRDTEKPLKEIFFDAIAKVDMGGIYYGAGIPESKLTNARAFFPIPDEEEVWGLLDSTWFGSCKEGIAFTSWGMRWTQSNCYIDRCRETSLSWKEFKVRGKVLPDNINQDVYITPFENGHFIGFRVGMTGCERDELAKVLTIVLEKLRS